MFFKNITMHRTEQGLGDMQGWHPLTLNEKLNERPGRRLDKHEPSFMGFVPLAPHLELPHVLKPHRIEVFAVQITDRVLPKACIDLQVSEEAAKIRENEGRPVGTKEMKGIRDAVTVALMPTALEKMKKIPVAFLAGQNMLIIGSASAKECDEIRSLLRETLGSLPVYPFIGDHQPARLMTGWVNNTAETPEGLELGDKCTLEMPKVGRISISDIDVDEVAPQLVDQYGMEVSAVNFQYSDGIGGQITSDLQIKSIKYADELIDRLNDDLGESTDDPVAVEQGTALLELNAIIGFIRLLDEPLGLRLGEGVNPEEPVYAG